MKLTLRQIALATQGTLTGIDRAIERVGIDTRTLAAGSLYVAIEGKNFDGHDFISQAQDAGAGAVMVARPVETSLPQIVVADTRIALAELAGFWRRSLAIKVAGVTGSNGKTTVKEMIAAIFSSQAETLATRGNLNNDIGVPLTLLELTEKHRYAVIEMGANHPGEIGYTSRYARADVSVITNVGPAHIEGFGDIHGVAKTKGEIIESLGEQGVAVLNRDDPFYSYWIEVAGSRKTVSFGLSVSADVRAENIDRGFRQSQFVSHFDLKTQAGNIAVELKLAGEHNIRNALAASAVALQFGIGLDDIKRSLEQLNPVIGRMQPLLGRKGNIVIDDTYNANPASLEAALNTVNGDSVWVVLGAFGELGEHSAALHRDMGTMIKNKSVQRLFATGELARHAVNAFGEGGQFFDHQEQLINALNDSISGKETLLVKGSRAQKMENVVAALVDNFRAA